MAEQLSKLRPDRDLQCYFQEPSTVAALSGTSASGFTVSGCFRQQFDWAVLEWNRDNVFEHPSLRNLPDGDLSGLKLSYEEARTGCLPFDSTAYDSIGWSYLRVWEEHTTPDGKSVEGYHEVPLKNYAVAESTSIAATAVMELEGIPTAGDVVELAWLEDHANYKIAAGDTPESAVAALAGAINGKTACVISAVADGARITLTYQGAPGSNGNRVGIYGGVQGAGTESWSPAWTFFSGGVSAPQWKVSLDFSKLRDKNGTAVYMTNVRKLRWTWAADLQLGNFERTEFSAAVANWQVTGSELGYYVAGPGSRRIEDDSPDLSMVGTWTEERGNYSGGSIRYTGANGDQVRCTYAAASAHTLYLGTRYVDCPAGTVKAGVQVDGTAPLIVDLSRPGEDVLIRYPVGQFGSGTHTVTVTNSGAGGNLYFDFLEIAVPTADLPSIAITPGTTLATDWDTNHSLALAPERTAWLIRKLGFQGRANHYAGAMWFYELCCPGNQYASATVQFAGTPQFLDITQITIAGTAIQHTNLTTDTPASIAKCFELLIAAGTSVVWAHADGATLTVTSRSMGTAGNSISISASNSSANLTATASGPTLTGGIGATADQDEAWRTDLNAMPRLNRAARDWSRSYFRALKGYGIDVAAAFSTELRHGDDSLSAGIAQRYPDGPVKVNTPALQTNFSTTSAAFWRQVYLDMASVMAQAGVSPYLQFGEVQWWYFADGAGMPFYDDFTTKSFQTVYGRPMALIASQNADPTQFPDECKFLPDLIGQFTDQIMAFVRQTHSDARFEVLYPPDVNDTPLNRLINLPTAHWTAANLACLKTENFTYTGDRNLDKARESIGLPGSLGFGPGQTSHLVGAGDFTTPWEKERQMAFAAGVESVVLFALDQVCLIGYDLPLDSNSGHARFMG